jgi:glycosyltransferase involved in cell wall biosynthesis
MKDLVSICIPVYNAGPYLEACLDSVLAQTFGNYEIIAVDDGSTDGSVSILESYASRFPKMKVHLNPKNLGLVGNWNRCLELSSGTWVKYVFQDDLLAPSCLDKMMDAAKKGSALVLSKREFLLEENASEDLKRYFRQTVLTLDKIYKGAVPAFLEARRISELCVKYISLNFIGEPSLILFRKDVLAEVGSFDADLGQICDLEFCLRIATRKGMAYVNEPLVQFRVHASSATSFNTTRKRFTSLFSDPAILSYKLLHDPVFSQFRQGISLTERIKLRLYHAMKLYEAHLFLNTEQGADAANQAAVLKKYPDFKGGARPGLFTLLAYRIARFRRKKNANN